MTRDFAHWYRTGRLAPFVRDHRTIPGVLSMIEAGQPAGDMSDPAVDDYVIVRNLTPGLTQRSDLGGGYFRAAASAQASFVLPPGVATRIEVYGPHIIRGFAIPAHVLDPILEIAPAVTSSLRSGALSGGPIDDHQMSQFLDLVWASANEDTAHGRLFADAAVQMVGAQLLRIFSGTAPQPRRGGLAPWQVRRVIDKIESSLAEDVSLAELADLVNLSRFHFCRAFRQSLGVPPHRYRLTRRMQRAEELLLANDLPVTEVAAAVGYDDPGRFATSFRKHSGMTPSVWRRERTA